MVSLYFNKIMCIHLNLHKDYNDCPSQIKDIWLTTSLIAALSCR